MTQAMQAGHVSSGVGESGIDVLVVEANAAAREWMRATLHVGYALRFADGMQEALAAVGQARPQVVVSEVDLCDGDGFELCRRMRQRPELRELPILLFTSRGSTSDKVRGFQAGADDYVVKPAERWVLLARLRLLQRIKSIEPPVLLGDRA